MKILESLDLVKRKSGLRQFGPLSLSLLALAARGALGESHDLIVDDLGIPQFDDFTILQGNSNVPGIVIANVLHGIAGTAPLTATGELNRHDR
jgi:hypothetical protein